MGLHVGLEPRSRVVGSARTDVQSKGEEKNETGTHTDLKHGMKW